MIALSHTLPCRGKSLIVVFLSSPMNLSKFLCNVHTCQSRQTLKLPLVHLIIFKVFAAPCPSHSLTGYLFSWGFGITRIQSCKRPCTESWQAWLLLLWCWDPSKTPHLKHEICAAGKKWPTVEGKKYNTNWDESLCTSALCGFYKWSICRHEQERNVW